MSGGHYPSINDTRSSQQCIAPRHRLPVTVAPRGPSSFGSNSAQSNASVSHTSWVNKSNVASNYHENSGNFGHVVNRDYSSISRAHSNDESSAWANPHYSNPSSNTRVHNPMTVKNIDSKGSVQQELMDLSASPHTTAGSQVVAAPCKELTTINGGADSRSLNVRTVSVDAMKNKSSASIDTNPSIMDSKISSASNSSSSTVANTHINSICSMKQEKNNTPTVSDNVEFALESMFQSDGRSVELYPLVSSTFCENIKEMCVDSVEKLLNSPSPERISDDDNLAILKDSASSRIDEIDQPTTEKSADATPAAQNDTTLNKVGAASQNCECTLQASAANAENWMVSQHERLTDIKSDESTAAQSSCDAKRENDQFSSEPASSAVVNASDNNNILATVSNGDSSTQCETTNNNKSNEEIIYVEVENELEKMFAGIEDTPTNCADRERSLSKPPDLSSIGLDSTNNLSSMSSDARQSQGTTSLFGSTPVPIIITTTKKKTSKKSKTANVSTKNSKDSRQKLSNSCRESSSLENANVRRVPVIHIEGSKENPISTHIINSIKSEEDDASSDGKSSAKRKLGKSDRVVQKSSINNALKNYDPGTSDGSWICIFCNLCAHAPGVSGEPTGDLFGPYFIRTPEQINLDESKRHSRKTKLLDQQVKKKQKRSLSVESRYLDSSASEEPKSVEIWAHENCIMWASGVYLIGSKLIGLEEAVIQALDTICAHCSNKGASIGCRARHCNSCAHYSCALYTHWKLDPETFISTCCVHSVSHK